MAESDRKSPQTPEPTVGRRVPVWLVFFAIVAGVLAVDLGIKAWSFEHIADTPILVRTHTGGGPEVFVVSPATGQWVSAYDNHLTQRREYVPHHEPAVVIPKLLNLQLTLNTGAVFGTGAGGRPVFIIVTVAAAGVILFLLFRAPLRARAYHVGLALILGGALGNLYDRVRFSAVRDMLHMLPGVELPFGLAWPGGAKEAWPWIFNPADVALVVGVGLVLLVSWLSERHRKSAEKTR